MSGGGADRALDALSESNGSTSTGWRAAPRCWPARSCRSGRL